MIYYFFLSFMIYYDYLACSRGRGRNYIARKLPIPPPLQIQ